MDSLTRKLKLYTPREPPIYPPQGAGRRDRNVGRHTPSEVGVMPGRHSPISHNWAQVIAQKGCGHCKMAKFGYLNLSKKKFTLLVPLRLLRLSLLRARSPVFAYVAHNHVDPHT